MTNKTTPTPTLDKLQDVFSAAATAGGNYTIKAGLRAVLETLIGAAPSREELQAVYDQYGLIGVRDYILGVDRLLPNPPVNMPPQYWELQAHYNELHDKFNDLQERHEELLRNNNEDVQALKKAQQIISDAKELFEVSVLEVFRASASTAIIQTNLKEIVKVLKQQKP